MIYHRGEMEGFWYTRNRKVYRIDIEDIHIKYLFEHFEDFGIKLSELIDVCDSLGIEPDPDMLAKYFDELSGSEQDRFFRLAYSHGNIRIRVYDCMEGEHIAIEFYSTIRNNYIIDCLIDMMDFFTSAKLPIHIFDYRTGDSQKFLSAKDALNYYAGDDNV